MLVQDINQQMMSSLALFKGISATNKGDIWGVVRDFVIATVKRNSITTFTIQLLRDSMRNSFNIDIENAVLSKVLSGLNYFSYDQIKKEYTTIPTLNTTDTKSFDKELLDYQKQCNELENDLYSFFKQELGKDCLLYKEKILYSDYFYRYIIDKEQTTNDYSTNEIVILINRFVLRYEKDSRRQLLFSSIRQGLIMLEGLNYSRMTDDKTWKNETTFFLDAHYLFSLYGFNSNYHKSSVEDFLNLVEQINKGSIREGKLIISYFPETKEVIEKFFNMAYRIKMGCESLDPQNEAMTKIVAMCAEAEDVFALKAKFYKKLVSKHILEYTKNIELLEGRDYLYETSELDTLVKKSFKEEEHEEVKNLFLFADYINILRKGYSVRELEKCRYIFLTDKQLALNVSKFLKKNDEQARTHVFEKMDWFTQRMWYLACQSLTFDKNLTSFDLAIKAKMVLSGICQNNVAEIYDKMKQRKDTDDEFRAMYVGMRNYKCSADDINDSNSKEIVDKFSEDGIAIFKESYHRMLEKAQGADAIMGENADLRKNIGELNEKLNFLSTELEKSMNEKETMKQGMTKLKRFVYVGMFASIVVIVLLVLYVLIFL